MRQELEDELVASQEKGLFARLEQHVEAIDRELGDDADMFMAAAYDGDYAIMDYLLVEREKRTASGVRRLLFPLVVFVQDLGDVAKASTRYERFLEELEERK